MALAVGTRLGPYEIIAALGAGGMGEVYRARDLQLKRLVAVKILPEKVAQDPVRRARLRREAEVLAALNHPNIASIFGIEESGTALALIMELVEGGPLNEKIPPRGMPLSNALGLAIQILRGLEAAHKVGIVHRDLKPSNIMVSPTNVVKLVDFGLAKPLESPPEEDEAETTVVTPKTEEGQIFGTVFYMSPEQAQGKSVDERSDIFSFGTLFYELLTGKRPFQGEDNITTLSAILHQDPRPFAELTATPLPREAERIALRCLRKDPDRRFQTASDLRIVLEDLKEDLSSGRLGTIPAGPSRTRAGWPLATATAAILAIIAGAGYWFVRPKPSAPRTLRQITFEAAVARDPALSPDGRLLAYATDRAADGQFDIWLKQVVGGNPVRLTSGPGSKSSPQFSADGTRIYFISGATISEVPTLGGPSRKIYEPAGPFTVSSRGDIAFYQPGTGTSPGPITILPANGGPPERWHPECRSAVPPIWSPDGDRIMFAGACDSASTRLTVFAAPRESGSLQRLLGAESLAPGIGPGIRLGPQFRWIWFRLRNGREGVIVSAPTGDSINLYRMSLDGTKEPITQGTGVESWPVVSSSGDLIFTRTEEMPAVWSLPLDVREQPTKEAAPAHNFGTSPDGRKLVYGRTLGARQGQLLMRDRVTGTETVLATLDVPADVPGSLWPQVSPDGTQVIYRMIPTGQYLVSVERGEPRRVAEFRNFSLASDWARDGKSVIGECAPPQEFPQAPRFTPRFRICSLDLASGIVRELLRGSQGVELLYPSFSWDGQWVTFMRRRSGRTVICVTSVQGDGTLAGDSNWIEISPEDGDATRPRFSPDGSTVYYELSRSGVLALVKQTLDPATKRAVAEPIQLSPVEFSGNGVNLITVTRDRVFFNTDEVRSNIWMTRLE